MDSGSTPCSSSAPATRSTRGVVFANRKAPVSVRMPTYNARAASAESGQPSAVARSNPTPIPDRFHFLVPKGADHSERAAREIEEVEPVWDGRGVRDPRPDSP